MTLQRTPSRDYRWVEVATASISTSACSPGVRALDSLIGEGVVGAELLNQYHSLAFRAVKSDSAIHLSAVTGGQRFAGGAHEVPMSASIGTTCFVIPVGGLVIRFYSFARGLWSTFPQFRCLDLSS